MFKLNVLTQPKICRANGFGPKAEKRCIKPTPIVSISFCDNNKETFIGEQFKTLALHATLLDEDGNICTEKEFTQSTFDKKKTPLDLNNNSTKHSQPTQMEKFYPGLVYNPNKRRTILGGLRIAECQYLYLNDCNEDKTNEKNKQAKNAIVLDGQNRNGCFFIFHDLWVTFEGAYRLKFDLIDITHRSSPVVILATIISDPFHCLTSRDYRNGIYEEVDYFKGQGTSMTWKGRRESRRIPKLYSTPHTTASEDNQGNAP